MESKMADDSNNNNNNNTNDSSMERRKGWKRSAADAELDTMEAPPAKYSKVAYQTPVLRVKKLSEDAKIPTKGSEYSAGYDLYAAHEGEIEPYGKALIKTDLSISMPLGCYGRIAPRSGLSWKHHIDIGAGVIDYDYRGNIGVVMFNHSNKLFKVDKHMRVAQLILERYEYDSVIVEVDQLDESVRGEKGFGSTGLVDKKDSTDKTITTSSVTTSTKDTDMESVTSLMKESGVKMASKVGNSNDENEKKDMEVENTGDATNVKNVESVATV